MIRVHAVIPAAGQGVRFGRPQNKVLVPLAGRPILCRAVAALQAVADAVVVVAREDEQETIEELLRLDGRSGFRVVAGGATRQESVRRGLNALDAHDDDVVLVHDGARPLISSEIILRCIDSAERFGSGAAAIPVSDTLKRTELSYAERLTLTEHIDRNNLWAMQTPQGFRASIIRDAHAKALSDGWQGTDEVSLVEHASGMPVHLVEGTRENIKVTTIADLDFAEQWLANSQTTAMRVGLGYDIHRLTEGRQLWLGGVQIPSAVGLDGHSDADVVVHALSDALLGAAALPDIGHLFPNDDPQYKGISSIRLLEQVVQALSREGWRPGNVDCMLIAEYPKIAPFISAMRLRLASAMAVEAGFVSIKATTNEGIGSLGAGEGIACHATASIVRIV